MFTEVVPVGGGADKERVLVVSVALAYFVIVNVVNNCKELSAAVRKGAL